MAEPRIVTLAPQDADRYTKLRRRMLAGAPWAFAATPESDRGLDVEGLQKSLAGDEYAIIAAEQGDELVGAAGLIRLSNVKLRHRAMVWASGSTKTNAAKGSAAQSWTA